VGAFQEARGGQRAVLDRASAHWLLKKKRLRSGEQAVEGDWCAA